MSRSEYTRMTLYTAPAVEPISVEEARRQCRITDTSEDDLLSTYVTAARECVEKLRGLACVNQTWDVYFERLDGDLLLPIMPVSSITSVKYQDGDNTQQTLATTYYEAAEWNRFGIVRLKYSQVWPSTLGHHDDVVVRVVFGYGASGASVPGPVRQVIRWLVGHQFENREPILTGTISKELEMTVGTFLRNYGYERMG